MNSNESKRPLPTPEEIQKDLQKFMEEKYGQNAPMVQADSLGSKETDVEEKKTTGEIIFTETPEELERYLRKYIVRQEDAIEILATKVATHFRRLSWEKNAGAKHEKLPGQIKPNILMIGPTGVGKTYIVKLIADKLGVPFVKGDATKFSETGYVGGDVEDLVRDLVRAAGGDIDLAEQGIIYIDEIDKIAASGNTVGLDVSRTGVQRNLLKMMEETEVELRVPHDLASQMEAVIETQKTGKAPRKKINTRNILFIVSGAFNGLDKIVMKRMNKRPMGFDSDTHETPKEADTLLHHATTQDLIEYGFESEFIGRLPVIARLDNLDVEGLFEVLTNDYNAVVQGKIRDFASYGIEFEFSRNALRRIAEEAYKERTGARGLTRVVERVVIPFEKRLPSTTIRKLVFTDTMMDNPQEACRDLVTGGSIEQAIAKFQEDTGVAISVSPAARKWLIDNLEDGQTPGDALLERLAKFHYAFGLLKKDSLQITASLLKDPKSYLEDLIRKSYQKEK